MTTSQQAVQLARLQTWTMSFMCGFLSLLAVAAATKIPLYINTSDYVRLIGTILFGLLALLGLVDNVHTHLCLRRLQTEGGGKDSA